MNRICFEEMTSCTGCGACVNICPAQALTIDLNAEGFYAPKIKEDKCIKCGKCKSVCPAIKFSTKNKNKPVSYAYAASDEERKNSTSGAFFPILAKYVLEQNGYVCGAAWNEKFEANHIIIDKLEDLQKIRFSKYVQSNTLDCFSRIKELLEQNKLVLFSGTPCQNAGLIKFLNKDYSNLITMDIICHGAPSPKVWQEYLDENFDRNKIVDINFRNKENGWVRCGKIWYYDNSSNINYDNGGKKPIGAYYEAFINHRLSNEPCMDCKYRTVPRPADFTCGDFWYLYQSKLNDKKGLSVVLLNNSKAEKIFNILKSKEDTKFFKKINLHNKYKHIELNQKSRRKPEREVFFKKYKEKNISTTKLIEASVGKHYDVGLVTQFNFMNYGSAIVAYAAYKIVESLGLTVLMIDKDLNGYDNNNSENRSLEFAKRNYHISRFYNQTEDPRDLNDLCDTFIVASDTMWWDTEYGVDFSWLDFARSDKRKISFCTSFAHKVPSMDNNQMAKRRFLYNRFNALSVREESGVEILKDMFGVDSVHLYDPTLVADRQIFDDLANLSKRTDKGFLFAYMLDLTPQKEKAVKYIADKLNLKLKLISNMRYNGDSPLIDENNISIEDFVYFCKNADFIMSDSFHGTCFSVIYEKPFISFVNAWRGNERYKIFKDNNLGNQLFENIDEIYNIDFSDFKVDFNEIKNKCETEKNKAIDWLKAALDKPLGDISKEDMLYDYIYNRNMEIQSHDYCDKNPRKGILKNIFSVRNEYRNNTKRKIITILYVKFSFKVRKKRRKNKGDSL